MVAAATAANVNEGGRVVGKHEQGEVSMNGGGEYKQGEYE